jgi:hypothetical protein
MESRRNFIKKSVIGSSALLMSTPLNWLHPWANNPTRRLANVNTTDIPDAIQLGCQTMGSVFNPDDQYIPYFGSLVGTESILAFSDAFSEAHVPGRHLNALLTAEDVLGIKIPEDTVKHHMNAAFFSYSGKLPLPLNRPHIGGELNRFLPHNLREGFHALYALTRYRKSEKAKQIAENSISFILNNWSAETGWNKSVFDQNGIGLFEWTGPFISGIARAIGPLVKYYQVTQSSQALTLIAKLRDKAMAEFFTEDGAFDWIKHGLHTHSVTCVMSSLAQLATLTQDGPLMHRVKAFFDHGLMKISDEIGWCIENAAPNVNPDRGEANNTGDILETALLLGQWGYASYYQNAERILRAHLLPSQLRDISFIEEPKNPDNIDGKKQVGKRHLGAFGFPAPYGHKPIGIDNPSFNMDIVGGAVASLCEAQKAIYQKGPQGHQVNLLFDYSSEHIDIQSPYTHSLWKIQVKSPGVLRVRIPEWVDLTTLKVTGASALETLQNQYLVIPEPRKNVPIEIRFDWSEQVVFLVHRTRKIRTRFKGDQVIGMDNFGADLTYFDPF